METYLKEKAQAKPASIQYSEVLLDKLDKKKGSGVPQFNLYKSARDNKQFRSKLDHFKKFTTEQYNVFNASRNEPTKGSTTDLINKPAEAQSRQSSMKQKNFGAGLEDIQVLQNYNVSALNNSSTAS